MHQQTGFPRSALYFCYGSSRPDAKRMPGENRYGCQRRSCLGAETDSRCIPGYRAVRQAAGFGWQRGAELCNLLVTRPVCPAGLPFQGLLRRSASSTRRMSSFSP